MNKHLAPINVLIDSVEVADKIGGEQFTIEIRENGSRSDATFIVVEPHCGNTILDGRLDRQDAERLRDALTSWLEG